MLASQNTPARTSDEEIGACSHGIILEDATTKFDEKLHVFIDDEHITTQQQAHNRICNMKIVLHSRLVAQKMRTVCVSLIPRMQCSKSNVQYLHSKNT